MIVRKFRKEDSKRMISLIKEFLEYTRATYDKNVLKFDDFIDSKKYEYSAHILNFFKNLKNSNFLVMEYNSKIIGYIVGFIEINPYKKMKKSGHGVSFFVSKKCRGKGHGKQLSKNLISWFKKNDCDYIEADPYMGNEKTILMYKRLGFRNVQIKIKMKI